MVVGGMYLLFDWLIWLTYYGEAGGKMQRIKHVKGKGKRKEESTIDCTVSRVWQRTGGKEKRGKGGGEEKVSEDINMDQYGPLYEW